MMPKEQTWTIRVRANKAEVCIREKGRDIPIKIWFFFQVP